MMRKYHFRPGVNGGMRNLHLVLLDFQAVHAAHMEAGQNRIAFPFRFLKALPHLLQRGRTCRCINVGGKRAGLI